MIYLAGPLFTEAERAWNQVLAARLEYKGFKVYLPQRDGDISSPSKCFIRHLSGIGNCAIMIGIMDGADPDSGTCWEVGYAYGHNAHIFEKKIKIVLIRTDIRYVSDCVSSRYNLMLEQASDFMLHGDMESWITDLINYLNKHDEKEVK